MFYEFNDFICYELKLAQNIFKKWKVLLEKNSTNLQLFPSL